MWRAAHCAILLAVVCTQARAQEVPGTTDAESASGEASDAAAAVRPVPSYGGAIGEREYLLGDLWSARTSLAESGIQWSLEWTQTVQSVVDGGRSTGAEYGGSVDALLAFDLERLGLVSGGALNIRAEGRYGESVNDRTGLLLPANTDAFIPITSEADESILTVTNFLYQQFISDEFGFFVGKFDNLESDFNEFASGRGTSQFMNADLVFTPTTLLEPYSSLGAFLFWAPSERVFVWGGAYSTNDSSTTSGFNDIDDGTSLFAEIYLQHGAEGLPPGGIALGGVYNVNGDFANLSSSRISLGPTGAVLTADSSSESWSLYANAWQYLWTAEPSDGIVVDVQNHEIDLRGVGLFLRTGTSDEDTNPIEWTISGGISGRGLLDSRPDDTFGLGAFYTKIRENRVFGALGIQDESSGFEAYYRASVTPAVDLSFDIQILDSPVRGTDDAVVLGTRLSMRF